MTRDFYFLQDSVTKLFYTGQYNWFLEFKYAAVYHTEKSALSHIKGIISAWEHDLKYPVESKYKEEFIKSNKAWPNDLVKERKNLKSWGIVLVKGTVTVI